MKKPKLFSLLNTFQKPEWNRFEVFVGSAYFNRREELLSLLHSLRSFHPQLAATDKPAAFRSAFPDRRLSSKWQNDRLSELHLLAERFLLVEDTAPTIGGDTVRLVRLLIRRGLGQEALRRVGRRERRLKAKNLLTAADYREWCELYRVVYDHSGHLPPKEIDRFTPSLILQWEELAHLLTSIRYWVDQLARSKTYREPVDTTPLEQLLAREQHLQQASPLLHYYGLLARAYQQRNPLASLDQLEADYQSLLPDLDQEEAAYLHIKLINLANDGIRHNLPDARHRLFRLYRLGIDSRILLPGGRLSEQTFLNVCVVAAGTDETDWAWLFWHDYQGHVLAPNAKTSIALGQAAIYFHSGDFAAALPILNRLSTADSIHKFRVHSLLLRCLLELHLTHTTYYEALLHRIDAFQQLIRREKKQSSTNLRGYAHFAQAVRRLARLKEENQPLAAWDTYLSWLTDLSPLQTKAWLVQRSRAASPAATPSSL